MEDNSDTQTEIESAIQCLKEISVSSGNLAHIEGFFGYTRSESVSKITQVLKHHTFENQHREEDRKKVIDLFQHLTKQGLGIILLQG